MDGLPVSVGCALRRLRMAALPVGGVVVGTLVTAFLFMTLGRSTATAQSGQSSDVRTERLTLVGPDGRPRAVLGELSIGDITGTGLVDYDADGSTPRVAQGVITTGQSGLIIFDSGGRSRLELASGWDGRDDGSVNITALDQRGTPRFELAFDPADQSAGVSFIRVRDHSGRVRGTLAADPEGGVGLFLNNPAGRQRVRVGNPPMGEPEAVILGEDGAVLWQAL
jgi:hypothetical protein